MFKFKIVYSVDSIGTFDREATVFGETLKEAEEKIKGFDPAFEKSCDITAKEYPHWNDGK